MASAVMSSASVMAPSTSALGVLSFLEESDQTLQLKALEHIYKIVDLHWAEVCDQLAIIEELSEDTSFAGAELAAAIASKCFYYLQDYDDALRLGLCSGKYLDLTERSEYMECLLSRCIDEYVASCHRKEADETETVDEKLVAVMEQLFQRCYTDGCFEQAMGIAIDAHQLDKVKEICHTALKSDASSAAKRPNSSSSNNSNILTYTFNICLGARNIVSREFRLATIRVLVDMYSTALSVPDYANMCFGYQLLDDHAQFAAILDRLLQGSDNDAVLAYQIAFDLLETENQGFVLRVIEAIPALQAAVMASGNGVINPPTTAAAAAAPAPATATATAAEGASAVTGEEGENAPLLGEENAAAAAAAPAVPELAVDAEVYATRIKKMKRIMSDGLDVSLVLNFLFKQCKSDYSILRALKASVDNRGSVPHNALVVAHAFMNAGTTWDVFLRENLEWLGKATHWAKFTAVGSLGVVNKGQIDLSMQLLQPYLPVQGRSSSPYSEAGALYALGLIHASKGGAAAGTEGAAGDSKIVRYLVNASRNAGNNDVVQHGACLGLGLAAMATADERHYEMLHGTLFSDSAISGEAAALAIGLLFIGKSDSPFFQTALPELITWAHGSQHEKIVRGLSLAFAMSVYGKEESADMLIEQLLTDRDPIIRYGGVFAVAMAYCGTSDNNAIKKLLHIAVSDVNDDVKRGSIISIGFVSCNSPETTPRLVALLTESFNPHVRYGAAMAIGIACAGSANKDATDILYGMLHDKVDYVRQGIYMSLALVLMQTAEARTSVVKKFRSHLKDVVNDHKTQSSAAKSGAIIAHGILDAGGRNVVMAMQSRRGVLKMGAAVGCLLWVQHWYWYPLALTLSLAFTPTVMIGLNDNFDMPTNYSVKCNAPPSVFAYPSNEVKKDDEKKFVATAVLSTTAKHNAREARKEAKKQGGSSRLSGIGPADGVPMSRQGSLSTPNKLGSGVGLNSLGSSAANSPTSPHQPPDSAGPPLERVYSHLSTTSYLSLEEKVDSKAKKAAEDASAAATAAAKKKEATFFVMKNPCRVTKAQTEYITTIPATEEAALAVEAAAATSSSSSATAEKMDTADNSNNSAAATAPAVRYVPIRHHYGSVSAPAPAPVGIVMLVQKQSDDDAATVQAPDESVIPVEVIAIGAGSVEEEAAPPAPFEWDPAL